MKNSGCLLEDASFSFHRCFDQSDTLRSRERAKQQKKRNSSHSWLTALINKREGGGCGALCISSCSLWGKNCDNRKMPENNTWLSKLIIYSACVYVCVFNEDLSKSNHYSKPGCELELHEMFSRGKTRGKKEDTCVFLCAKDSHTSKHWTVDWKTSMLRLLNVSFSNKRFVKIRFKKMLPLAFRFVNTVYALLEGKHEGIISNEHWLLTFRAV